SAAGAGAGAGAGLGAGFFFGALFFGALFFAAAFFAFFTDFFAAFLADFFAPFFFFAATYFFAFFAFLPFAFFFAFFAILIILLLPPISDYRTSRISLSAVPSAQSQFSAGRGPPVAQSRSSIVCTTGTDVPPAICTMQPILPAAITSGPTLAILATLRSRNLPASSGWRMLYVPAEPQHKWLSGTSFTTKPFLESNSFGACVIFCPCCSEQAA